jgi:hypothetical protein
MTQMEKRAPSLNKKNPTRNKWYHRRRALMMPHICCKMGFSYLMVAHVLPIVSCVGEAFIVLVMKQLLLRKKLTETLKNRRSGGYGRTASSIRVMSLPLQAPLDD